MRPSRCVCLRRVLMQKVAKELLSMLSQPQYAERMAQVRGGTRWMLTAGVLRGW